MPQPGKLWRHCTISTHGSWLPGDRRGFRSRGHRLHSSGDYKDPPPPEEHEGLRRYHQDRAGPARLIPLAARAVIGRALIAKLTALGHRVLAVSVGTTHAHYAAELPADRVQVKRIAGQCKQASSHAARDLLPGKVWAEGGSFRPVGSRRGLHRVCLYILEEQEPDAWTWCYTQGPPAAGA